MQRPRVPEFNEGGPGQEHGVARPAGPRGLADLGRVSGGEADQGLQCCLAEVGLVPKHDGEVSQAALPRRPSGGALNRAEHAALRRGIHDAMRRRKSQPIQFHFDCPISGRANNRDLSGSGRHPLGNQMAEHGCAPPGQQQFRPSHPPRLPGAEQKRPERESRGLYAAGHAGIHARGNFQNMARA